MRQFESLFIIQIVLILILENTIFIPILQLVK